MRSIKKKIVIVLALFLFLFSPQFIKLSVFGDDTPTSTSTQNSCVVSSSICKNQGITDCNACSDYLNKSQIDLRGEISNLQGQESTLKSQIAIMDNQIKLTEYQIEATQEQITSISLDIDTASKKISSLQESLNNSITVLLNRIVATYEVGTIQPLQILLTSGSASDFFTRLNYLKLAQAHDKKLIYDTQQAKVDYSNQKNIFEDKKKQILVLQAQLQAESDQLDQERQAKQDLLSQTQGSEENYQTILAQTEAQLASFQGFVISQGGASLLSNQTVCDGWGCYYNQRDNQWGGNSLNGTQYTLADSGCLITSMAMVYTHYGHRDVNPQSINSNSSNFTGIPAALLKYSITANGVSSQRIGASIDSVLSGGDPVIVGISYDGGPLPDHFVVLISGSNGNYIMNDPFTPNGHEISFTSHYSVGSIVEIDRVSF